MFLETDIKALVDRLGWSENENQTYTRKLDSDNKVKNSGLTLNSFHELVTVENIFNCHPQIDITDRYLNSYLKELLDNVIRTILTDVFVSDSRAKNNVDYSSIIASCVDTGIFDATIGYCHAVQVVELIAASVRSNRIEAILGYNYGKLMSELKGYSTKQGVLVSKGLFHHCQESREAIKTKIYGIADGETVICDATNEW